MINDKRLIYKKKWIKQMNGMMCQCQYIKMPEEQQPAFVHYLIYSHQSAII